MLHYLCHKAIKQKGRTTMTYKDFGEDAEIEVTLIVKVNGTPVWDREYGDLDFIFDDFRKIENEIASELQYQFNDLAEDTLGE